VLISFFAPGDISPLKDFSYLRLSASGYLMFSEIGFGGVFKIDIFFTRSPDANKKATDRHYLTRFS